MTDGPANPEGFTTELMARLQAAEQLAADLRAAVTTYHLALDRRENGNSAG